jgi:hypothetical protein
VRNQVLGGLALLLGGAAGCKPAPAPVVAGRVMCSDGPVEARGDEGDDAHCLVPIVACDAAADLESDTWCHFPPASSPSKACCDPRPAQCAPTDCDCLLQNGPWIDYALAQDAGVAWPYTGPKRVCSYRVSCTPAADGGVAVLVCHPA